MSRSGFESHLGVEPPFGLRCTFRIQTLLRPSSVLSIRLHTSLGRRRVLPPPTYLRLRAFPPPPALRCLPVAWSSNHTGLWRAQGSASDSRAALNIPRLARILARFRGRLRLHPSHWQCQQRESCQCGRLSDCYPSLTPLTDKEQIFSRQNSTVISRAPRDFGK